ncbi:MAG: SulP family inorganic anion transporter [Chloroflexi bacterium]|nr:SulP family inorganic anion transporter [Chloroflexota bacterium]
MEQVVKRFSFNYDLETLKGDIFGGLTATVVGLPVALAFGVASGLGAIAGIYGAIAVGFFASVFGGTKSQISGPTGPMTVAMATVVTLAGPDNLGEAFGIVVLAGIIQILLGVLKIGRFVAYTPYSVISGFMSGIGVIIIILQILPFVGAEGVSGGPVGAIRAIPDAIPNVHFGALTIAAATLAVGILWPEKLHRYFPSTLAALVTGSLLGVLWLTSAPVIGEVPSGLPSLHIPQISGDFLVKAVQPALIIALLGSIDSLLTSLIADSMTRTRHNANKELVGQGIGNTIAGFIGGLPGSGATLGTVVNLRGGGRTPISGVIYASILLALVLGIGRYVENIPHAVLAGILLKVGWDIIDWRFITRIHRVQREHLIVMVITMFLTVFLDLVTAVAIGLIAAGMATARQLERLELDSVVSVPILDQVFFTGYKAARSFDMLSARVGVIALRGSFTVSSSSRLITTISEDIREHEVVILDFTDTVFIDDSAALVVEQMIDVAIAEDTHCILAGLGGVPETTLRALNAIDKVSEEHLVDDLESAKVVALEMLGFETERET